ncbi:melatonin receptor type 1A-like [Montipora capricornis]|uniref:melatonin receptor type 1A-like n=1 Tax=Montipora capricornis TaxID=246305 RepID=UPI0035F18047
MSNTATTLPPRSTFLVVLESGLALLWMFLAFAGNLTVFVAISKNKQLRTVPNFLLLNLAIADIFSTVITLPALVSVLVLGGWTFHPLVCQFQAFQAYTSYCCNLLTLAVSSISRYYATAHPIKYRITFQVHRICLMIAIIWIASLLIASVPVLGWGRYRFEPLYALCVHETNFSPSFDVFLFFLLMLNATVIVACYSRIFRAVKKRHRSVNFLLATRSCSRQLELMNRQETRQTNTIFIVICLFAVCYLPTIVIGFVVFTPVQVPRFARMFSTFSVSFTSVVNPIVYWMRTKSFRDALKGLFGRRAATVQQSSQQGGAQRNVSVV